MKLNYGIFAFLPPPPLVSWTRPRLHGALDGNGPIATPYQPSHTGD